MTIQKESAMPNKMRRATLVQEGITRLLNTSSELGEGKENEILTKYMKKLQSSGYNHSERIQILKSIKNAWKIIVKKDQSGERPLYRSRSYEKEERMKAKEKKKTNWFKTNSKGEKIYDSVLFIPATPESALKKEIEDEAKACDLRVKVVERPGKKLIDYMKSFVKKEETPKCEEKDCLSCGSDGKSGEKCRKTNVVYKISCIECKSAKKSANYYGESNFNAYTRGKQHLDKYNSRNVNTQEKSAMKQHAINVHEGRQVKYEMTILKSFKEDPLARQIYESIKIVESKENDDFPLNSKNEFNQALIVTAKFSRGIYD